MNLAHLTTDSICVLSFSLIHTLLCGLIDRITWHVRDGRGDVYLLWNTRGTYRHLEVLVGKDWDHFDCQVMMGLLCKFGRQLQEWLRQNVSFMSIMFLNFHGALSLVDPLWDPRVSNHISLLGELKRLQTASQVKHFNSPTDTCELGFGAQSRMGFQTIFPSRGIWALHRWYWKFALQDETKSPHWNFMAIIEFPQSTDPLLPH